MVDNPLASARFRPHGRFRIPTGNRAALDYYLNDLFVPGSRTESILTPLVRRFDTVADRLLGRGESDGLPGRTPLEWSEIAEGLTANLHRVRKDHDRETSFLILTDYAHSNRGQLVVFVFCGTGTKPVAIAKVRTIGSDGDRLRGEFVTLQGLRRNEALQSSLPEPIALFDTARDTVLLESAVPGRSLHFLLRNNRPSEAEIYRHFQLAFDWLARFHKATYAGSVAVGEIAEKYFAQAVMEIGRIPDITPHESALVENLRSSMSDLRREKLPVASVHGDFWARNLMLADSGQISVIDWEGFESEGLPLDDALMLTVSYGLSFQWQFGKWEDPGKAFRRMFANSDATGSIAMRSLNEFCAGVGIDADLLRVLIPLFLLRRITYALRADGKNPEEVDRWRKMLRAYGESSG